jgi:hypothetical protein
MGWMKQDCPVCGNKNTAIAEDPYDLDAAAKFDCQPECGMFAMSLSFFQNDWPYITDENKKALAAYLKNREKPRDRPLIISEDNYRCFAKKGRELLKRAPSPQVPS